MSVNTGEIQPVTSEQWVTSEVSKREVPTVSPVAKVEGGTASKIGDDRQRPDTSGSSQPDPNEVAEELQSFVHDTMNIELNFRVDDKGKTVVQVLDRSTGEIIRQIPPEKFAKIHDKLEELRGVLFDGKV
ncbi:MAG: flagellar protein FlaG [Desulfobacteraceae bacterium]|nr:flagellar protein FlaG [Desulfobacteraceae bacterium]